MRKPYTLFMLALVPMVGACGENGPTDPVPTASFSNGAAAPGTGVLVTFTIPGEETEGYWLGAGVAFAAAANDSCYEIAGVAGYYKNPAGNATGSNQNAGKCWVAGTAGEPEVISFTVYANHVQARSGNEQLNFGSVCDPEDPDACSDTWVHYKANSNWSNGKGMLFGSGYSIDLSSIDEAGNVIANRPILVTACAAGSCYGAELDW